MGSEQGSASSHLYRYNPVSALLMVFELSLLLTRCQFKFKSSILALNDHVIDCAHGNHFTKLQSSPAAQKQKWKQVLNISLCLIQLALTVDSARLSSHLPKPWNENWLTTDKPILQNVDQTTTSWMKIHTQKLVGGREFL